MLIFTEPLLTILPISGSALQVGNSHYHDLGWPQPINDLVRKPGNQHATGSTIGGHHVTDFGVGFDDGQSCGDGIEELTTECSSPSLVPADSFGKFAGRRFT